MKSNNVNLSVLWNKPYRKKNKKGIVSSFELNSDNSMISKKENKISSNIVFVIDKSGSMNSSISGRLEESYFYNKGYDINSLNNNNLNKLFLLGNLGESKTSFTRKTKLDHVVSAVISSISLLRDEDCFSIVTFSDKAEVIFEMQNATIEAKHNAFAVLNNIRAGGSTSLFEGWENGVLQLSQKSKNENVNNRVILLTDGQSTDNVNPKSFCKVVSDIAKISNITTTTFGVGEGFNETLLMDLASEGEGNFYFIEEKSNITDMFEKEMYDISNINFKNVRMKISGHNFENLELLNSFKKDEEGFYLLPNIISNKNIKFLIRGDALGKDAQVKIHLECFDNNNRSLVINLFSFTVDISKEDYINHEVEEDVIRIIVGNIQKDISNSILNGDILKAKEFVENARGLAKFIKGKDGEVLVAKLEETKNNINLGNHSSASKSMAYSSYCINYSK